MKRSLVGVAVVLALAAAAIAAAAALRPDEFTVQRNLRIKAPPEKIAALIADFHAWGAWSPYEKLDPAMQRGYAGAPSGKGAVYTWRSEGKAGAGRMEIIDTNRLRILIRLDFSSPFEAHNLAEFIFAPDGDATSVTWEMRGPNPFIAKVMQLFTDFDAMIGRDFEAGLANLKTAAES